MILVLRALGIGDLATGVPAIRGLRRAFPDECLTLAVPRWLEPLVSLIGRVDRVDPTDGLAPRRWPGPSPRVAVNLHGRGPQSHALLAAAGASAMWGFACAGFPAGPRWSADEHEVQRWRRMLAWFGVDSDPTDLTLRRPTEPAAVSQATIIHPGAKAPQRRWPADRFATVARELAAAGHLVVVTGSAGDRPLAMSVAAAAGLPAEAVLAGYTDTGGLAAVIADSRLVISGDTGVSHLATAFGRPSVTLFGPISPRLWGPPARARHRTLWAGPTAGRTSPDDGPHPALAALSVPQVLDAAEQAQAGHCESG
ncbi:glycosyltransferase family 9 protein [Pilimelia columellifera]|uniref:Glycosyltransferase family 9 protein n=1 Tax=Pilimelia columellifera subsp. columellifera TaxID=706583 RepID=A0ABN3NC19_9ACTN